MNPINIGWTIQKWQDAYKTNKIDINILYELRYYLLSKLNDSAWISIVDEENLKWQIENLNKIDNENLPLYGIPFAVKDNIDVLNIKTTAACPDFAYEAKKDAFVVEQLRLAGAIVMGKTNLDQFATGLVGTRSPYGKVPNTFKEEYISGGSSSGSASVVARGLVPFALGTDTAGSGRVPAGFNNIVGLKPTLGSFSIEGLVPACKNLDCISVFSLTVEDAEIINNIISKYNPNDEYSIKNPQTAPFTFNKNPIFAIPNNLEFFNDSISGQSFNQIISRLKKLGINFKLIDFSIFKELADQLYKGPWVAQRTASIEKFIDDSSNNLDENVKNIILQGKNYSAIDTYNAEYLKTKLADQINKELSKVDALLVPTAPTIYKMEDIDKEPILYNSNLGFYTNFVNLANLSALALPGTIKKDGLPFGITLIAPSWHEQALMNFGKIWQHYNNLPLGNTFQLLPPNYLPKNYESPNHILVAVVGAHLTKMPLNYQLTERNAVLIEETKTAPKYKLFALKNTTPKKPGLIKVNGKGQSIIVELWSIPISKLGEFVNDIPPPLGIGSIELIDGSIVKGFICENYPILESEDISFFGGWRKYLESIK